MQGLLQGKDRDGMTVPVDRMTRWSFIALVSMRGSSAC